MKTMYNKECLVYSDSLEELIIRRFRKGKHVYIWNDADCMYYRDDTEEIAYSEVPNNATILTAF